MSRLLIALLIAGLTLAGACTGRSDRPRIGVLSIASTTDEILASAERQLARYGFEVGSDVELVYDGLVDDPERLDAAAAALVRQGVDLVLAISTPAAIAATTATEGTDIGVVFISADPGRAGLLAAGATGVASADAMEKRVELLTTMLPGIGRIVVLELSTDRASVVSALAALLAASEREVDATVASVDDPSHGADALRGLAFDYEAVVLTASSSWSNHDTAIVHAAAQRGAVVVGGTSRADAGFVINYASTSAALGEQVAHILATAVEGTPISDIPVEAARLDLTVDVSAAERVGVGMPADLLARADRIVGLATSR